MSKKLRSLGTYRPLFFKPYFHTEEFPYIDDRPQDKFRFGRIYRDDGDKFNSRQLWIYDTMTAQSDCAILGSLVWLRWCDFCRLLRDGEG